jgi:hypothetical protein
MASHGWRRYVRTVSRNDPVSLCRGICLCGVGVWDLDPRGTGAFDPSRATIISVIEVCRFVDQFTDRLPERVYLKLRSYMRDYPDAKLKADLAADPSYATAARGLRKMIDHRTEDHKLREASRQNLK